MFYIETPHKKKTQNRNNVMPPEGVRNRKLLILTPLKKLA